jgi:hypothetical protein
VSSDVEPSRTSRPVILESSYAERTSEYVAPPAMNRTSRLLRFSPLEASSLYFPRTWFRLGRRHSRTQNGEEGKKA